MTLRSILLAIMLAVVVASPAGAQVYKGVELVKADLLSDATSVMPGIPFTVGLRLKMEPRWHSYWEYSGDAGLPTKIDWKLPAGFQAGPIEWPIPERIDSPGDIVNYGYSDEVVLLTEITPPATFAAGSPVKIEATADWLVCAELCVPGKAELTLNLPADARPENTAILRRYQALVPRKPDASGKFPGGVAFAKNPTGGVTVSLNGPAGAFAGTPTFFPLVSAGEIGHPAPVVREADGSSVHAAVPVESAPAKVGGVFVFPDHKAYYVPASDLARPVVSRTAPPPAAIQDIGSVWHYLLFGLLGGLILNVMPCVLPVISLKIFSFVKQANDAPARIFKMGLAYAAGVFAWFLGFAALVIILKAGGREVGYGFHLQNVWFIVGLSAAVFVFSLNLLGVFEFILPGAAAGALSDVSQHSGGYFGAFLQGVLATVLGSACTAPVFGTALAFAFGQSAPVILAMFAAIALGMSLPFLLLTAFPAWLRFLPRPGVWMERVKQATGFLMLATLLWLMSILGAMKGSDAVVWLGVLLLALGAACWIQGSFNTLLASVRTRAFSWVAIVAVVVAGAWISLGQIANAKLPGAAADFPAQLKAALKTPGRPVFVDFTAAWCVNCKFYERSVLNTDPVQKALRDTNAVFLTADYTNYSPAITELLRQFHSVGVPLYVVYPAERTRDPIKLPDIITKQIVIDGLKAAADNRKMAAAP